MLQERESVLLDSHIRTWKGKCSDEARNEREQAGTSHDQRQDWDKGATD